MTGNGWFMQNLNNISIDVAFVLRSAGADPREKNNNFDIPPQISGVVSVSLFVAHF